MAPQFTLRKPEFKSPPSDRPQCPLPSPSEAECPAPPQPGAPIFSHHVGKSGTPANPFLLKPPKWSLLLGKHRCLLYLAVRMVEFKLFRSESVTWIASTCVTSDSPPRPPAPTSPTSAVRDKVCEVLRLPLWAGPMQVTVLYSNEAASGEKEQLLLNSPINLGSTVSAEPFLVKVNPRSQPAI